MPQIDFSYTSDLSPDPYAVMEKTEAILKEIDSTIGICKGRTFKVDVYRSSHALVRIEMLTKEHRDEALLNSMAVAIKDMLKTQLNSACIIDVMIRFEPTTAVSERYTP